MNVLALEGYMGGSHKAFLDGWVEKSRHEWTVLSLPANKWKWRMRHSAITFAEDVNVRIGEGDKWDVLFCSDMLNLAEFSGLVGGPVRELPKVVYFHENQLTYPVRFANERDYQYVMTNLTTAMAADCVWFNSGFHRDEFLAAIDKFLKRMPDNQPFDAIEAIRDKSSVHPPGIHPFDVRAERKPGPVRILWAARWEHDKNPEDFFAAMKVLKEKGVEFRLSVIGEQFCESPEVFEWAKGFFSDEIERWGYQDTLAEYRAALIEADIIASTANHEFFGISMVEAIAAGCYPVLPKRLAYPEIAAGVETVCEDEFVYDGTVDGLIEKLSDLSNRSDLWCGDCNRGVSAMGRYMWDIRAKALDDSLGEMIE